jgi:hypothetical protein
MFTTGPFLIRRLYEPSEQTYALAVPYLYLDGTKVRAAAVFTAGVAPRGLCGALTPRRIAPWPSAARP